MDAYLFSPQRLLLNMISGNIGQAFGLSLDDIPEARDLSRHRAKLNAELSDLREQSTAELVSRVAAGHVPTDVEIGALANRQTRANVLRDALAELDGNISIALMDASEDILARVNAEHVTPAIGRLRRVANETTDADTVETLVKAKRFEVSHLLANADAELAVLGDAMRLRNRLTGISLDTWTHSGITAKSSVAAWLRALRSGETLRDYAEGDITGVVSVTLVEDDDTPGAARRKRARESRGWESVNLD